MNIWYTNIAISSCNDRLTECNLEKYDLSKGNIIDALQEIKTLKKMSLRDCRTELTIENDEKKDVTVILDVSKCTHLDSFLIRSTNTAFNVCTSGLTVCILEKYDLSKGNIVNVLQETHTLNQLTLHGCESGLSSGDNIKKTGRAVLDISKCEYLDTLDYAVPMSLLLFVPVI